MDKKQYIPNPIDTSDITLDEGLSALVEQMARNVHEVWAQSRISQGWTWGPQRDDTLKTHPDLVPYEDLTEVEKQYDRDTANATLKLIIKLGYNINKE